MTMLKTSTEVQKKKYVDKSKQKAEVSEIHRSLMKYSDSRDSLLERKVRT